MREKLHLEDIKKLRIAYTTTVTLPVKSLNFHYNGECLIFNTDRELVSLRLSDQEVHRHHVMLDKYGCGISKFYDMHGIHSSTRINNALRLMDLEEREYIRYFAGHSSLVTSLDVASNRIVSSSKDSTVKLWDPRQEQRIEERKFPSQTLLVAFHPGEAFFAVAYNSSVIEIFSVDNLKESREKFELRGTANVEWTDIKFSSDGELLMITTNSSLIIIFNILKKKECQNFKDYNNTLKETIHASFAPESNFCFGGSADGFIHVWNLKSSFKDFSLKSDFKGGCHFVQFNPKFANLASTSGGRNVHLWNEQ